MLKRKKAFLIVAIIALVAALGALIYFSFAGAKREPGAYGLSFVCAGPEDEYAG